MLRLKLSRAFLALFIVVAVASRAAETAPKESPLIQATDLLKLKQLDSPALSPDGKWVVYVVKSIEPKPDAKDDWTYQSHLWLAAVDGSSAPRQLTRTGSDSSPQWHPSGDRLAFVRTIEKEKPQVFVISLAGGEAAALTKVDTGAGSPRWSPDGGRILFTSSLNYAQVRSALEKAGADTKPKWATEQPGRANNDTAIYGLKNGDKAKDKEAAAKTPKADADGSLQERREWLAKNEADGNPRSLQRLGFLSESDINPEITFTHVYVQDAKEGAEAKDLTPGYTGFVGAEWMMDGTSIVCAGPRNLAEHPDRNERFDLYLVDAAGDGPKLFLTSKDYSLGSPLPAPNGKSVALTATPGEAFGFGQSAVAVVPASGGELKLLTTKLDRSAGNLQWSDDSKAIFFVVAKEGGFPLYRVATDGSVEAEKLTRRADTGVRAYDIGHGTLVDVRTTASSPYELHARSAADKIDRTLTTHNTSWLTGKKLTATEEHHFTNEKGETVQYWTMKPAEFDAAKKYPLLVQIHGGPSAMWGPGEDSMWFEFQYFAARGYAIVYSNPRGSGGYGYDFQHANYQDWGTGPSSDILAAADAAAKESFVDAKRQVVTGGSYGGYMVGWIVGHDQRFKAAVAQRGVYDLTTFFGEGNAWRLVPRAFGGYPWQPDIRAILARESPFTYVEAIKTPLLIQHGDNDRRTGFVQSEMMFKSLKVLGRDVEEVRYPRATHEMSRSGEPKQRLDSLVRYEEFFRRYIGEN